MVELLLQLQGHQRLREPQGILREGGFELGAVAEQQPRICVHIARPAFHPAGDDTGAHTGDADTPAIVAGAEFAAHLRCQQKRRAGATGHGSLPRRRTGGGAVGALAAGSPASACRWPAALRAPWRSGAGVQRLAVRDGRESVALAPTLWHRWPDCRSVQAQNRAALGVAGRAGAAIRTGRRGESVEVVARRRLHHLSECACNRSAGAEWNCCRKQ